MKATILVQRVFGFSFLAFGLNGFVHFIPHVGVRNAALEFFLGLAATGYMLPLLYITQATAGALLLVWSLCAVGARDARSGHPQHFAVSHLSWRLPNFRSR